MGFFISHDQLAGAFPIGGGRCENFRSAGHARALLRLVNLDAFLVLAFFPCFVLLFLSIGHVAFEVSLEIV